MILFLNKLMNWAKMKIQMVTFRGPVVKRQLLINSLKTKVGGSLDCCYLQVPSVAGVRINGRDWWIGMAACVISYFVMGCSVRVCDQRYTFHWKGMICMYYVK